MTVNCATVATIVEAAMDLVDSDSSDEEFDNLVAMLAVKLVRKERNRIPRYYEDVVGSYFEFEFKRLFRLSRETFNCLADRYRASPFFPENRGGRTRIGAEKTCLIVLSYLGSQCSMYSIADRFDVTESSVHACVERVLKLLQSMSEEVIAWPHQQQQELSKVGFLMKSGGKGPRNTIGCVDGSHVEIKIPNESPHSYFNRKKFPSLILQGICNHENKFIDVLVGFPGSAHDARVLREGPFFEVAASKCSNGYILGDSAYPLLPWLMTPYKDTQQSFPAWKKKYKCHSQQRISIEIAFGRLKQRFRRLYLVDAATIKQCCLIIMGACVLHNLCNEERDFFEELRELPALDEVGNDEESGLLVDRSVAGYRVYVWIITAGIVTGALLLGLVVWLVVFRLRRPKRNGDSAEPPLLTREPWHRKSIGVIYGLLPSTSSAEIVAGLRVDPRYTVLGARMLGRPSTAVITFDGPHVPYYITYQSGDYRCKLYRKSEQYCRKCGAKGTDKTYAPGPEKPFVTSAAKKQLAKPTTACPSAKYANRHTSLPVKSARRSYDRPTALPSETAATHKGKSPRVSLESKLRRISRAQQPAYCLGQPTARAAWPEQLNPAIAVQVSYEIPVAFSLTFCPANKLCRCGAGRLEILPQVHFGIACRDRCT
ncbi:hypothetical protein HPB50_002683 [Hyalomma asiaticum]|uniref:Uncharacterized protein n=1 Tax=Hyalomma asiaticum TaxID=266040 RepID=A0ACB7TBW2_HYAAI|nr:hypothetical protein HPB50_002683 [Hyalomma asiaticum]